MADSSSAPSSTRLPAQGRDASSTLVLADGELADGLITLRDCLRWATSEFHLAGLTYSHGTDSAWDEAVALVLGRAASTLGR